MTYKFYAKGLGRTYIAVVDNRMQTMQKDNKKISKSPFKKSTYEEGVINRFLDTQNSSDNFLIFPCSELSQLSSAAPLYR